ncbi:cell wall hydrolase [Haloplasma contractile]|uniref:Cell wall hydrolase protein n=1 Tax=Haloplasma contractile SSD-17B TaxID=1033810 RepID=U2ECJ1_9MOLU|nr:cell wall hydrolase [Haloplasma contractile]ERJ12481.1 Cell wall hydrolase protein [Haloplasma contractile SSD-17B]
MAVIPYNWKEVELLARLIRAEAEGDGKLGMLLAGNVGVNRVRADCLDFKDIRSLQQMIFQSPGGFEATQKSYFYQPARQIDIELAKRVINGERFVPATRSLWFYNPFDATCRAQWFGQWNTGRYKSHCFYAPTEAEGCY